MTNRKGNMKRIHLVIHEDIYKELKKIQQARYMTMTGLIAQALVQRIAWEKKYQ